MARTGRLLIVHSDHLHGQCLLHALLSRCSFSSVRLALDAVETFERVKEEPPDLILVDWHLPHGAAPGLTRWLASQSPPIAVLVLGLADTAQGEWARNMTGATGFVLRTHTLDDLVERVHQVLRADPSTPRAGDSCSPPLGANAHPAFVANDRPKFNTLSAREQQIVLLIDQGLTNKEIAEKLFLSLHTVKNHIHNLLTKLEVESRYEAARVCAPRC